MGAVTVSEVRSRPGLTFRPGDPGYDERRAGFNLAVDHRPAVIVDAGAPADVVAAVRLAGRQGRPVAVMNTGHGPSVAADGAVLIRTGRLRRVEVDPGRRTAWVEGGAVWQDVIDAAAPHRLAPLNGSSPAVGVGGYTLNGGIGLLARRFGFAADHVRSVDLVTADGQLRHLTAGSDPDLFWALRGAGANFGVVTAMEIDLFPVPTLLGGELVFPAEAGGEVLAAYASWSAAVPETMASSVLLTSEGSYVRVADSGEDHAEGRRWVDRLRRIGPRLADTVRVMPYRDVGTIHHEPVDTPVPAFDRNVLLSRFDAGAAMALARHAVPAGVIAELRAWGGALSRPADPPNAVGGRDARFSLVAIADPDPGARAGRDALLDALRPWSTGGTYPNFSGVEDTSVEAVRRAYRPEDFARLRRLKAAYDPDNRFRVNFNIPPEGRAPAMTGVDEAAAMRFLTAHARVLDRRRAADDRPGALGALEGYRNADGGYGWGLEPDLRAPESQPGGALHAFEVFGDAAPMVTPRAAELCDWLASVSLADGGMPFALPVADATATAPFWAGADHTSSSLHITTAVTAAAWRVARHDPAVAGHAWLDRATRYCLDTLAARPAAEHAIELLFVLDLLDTLVDGPAPPEAEPLLARIAATLPASAELAVGGGLEDEKLRPLDLSPWPDRPLRRHIAPAVIEADLDRLAADQRPDGGWDIDFHPYSPAAALEWRGYATVRALTVLRAHDRLPGSDQDLGGFTRSLR